MKSVAPTRHRVTCHSKPGIGGIFSCFGPFLLHAICPKVLVLKSVLSMYIVSKAVAHVAVDLQCWTL